MYYLTNSRPDKRRNNKTQLYKATKNFEAQLNETKFELAEKLRQIIERAVIGIVNIELDKNVMKLKIIDSMYHFSTLVWYENITKIGLDKIALDILHAYMREIARRYIQLDELAKLSMSASGNESIYTF